MQIESSLLYQVRHSTLFWYSLRTADYCKPHIMTSAVLNDHPIPALPQFLTPDELTSRGITTTDQHRVYHTQCIRSAYRADKWYNTSKTACIRMEGVRLTYTEAQALYWYIRERQIELRAQHKLYKTAPEIRNDKLLRKQRKLAKHSSNNSPNNKQTKPDIDDTYDKENVDPITGASPNHKHDTSTHNDIQNDTVLSSDQQYIHDNPLNTDDVDVQEYVTILRLLRERILDIITKSGMQRTGFCITVDGVSVFDSAVYGYKNDEVKSLLADNLSSIPTNERDSNLEYMLYTKSIHNACKLNDDKDVIDIMSHSYNILNHLRQLLSINDPDLFDCQIILREWVTELPVRSEYQFRCFLNNRQLTAATQKQSDVYYSDVYTEHTEIEKRIRDYITQLLSKQLIPYDSCILDVLLLDTYIILLDIKPFQSFVDAGCYNWTKHTKQLHNGPYTLKMLTNGIPNVKKSLHPVWHKFIDTECKPMELNAVQRMYKQYEPVVHGVMVLLLVVVATALINVFGNKLEEDPGL